MTEAEWLAATREDDLLRVVAPRTAPPNDRRLRLFAAACVRSAHEPFTDDRLREAVEVVESFAGAKTNAGRRQIKVARQIAHELFQRDHTVERGQVVDPPTAGYWLLDTLVRIPAAEAAYETSYRCIHLDRLSGRDTAVGIRHRIQLLRDIFGNPFRPVTVRRAWLTSTVRGLAEGIYADRAFDRMPILADALEDAGCDNADILGHCRGDGPHVRGCWVVDLILGKE